MFQCNFKFNTNDPAVFERVTKLMNNRIDNYQSHNEIKKNFFNRWFKNLSSTDVLRQKNVYTEVKKKKIILNVQRPSQDLMSLKVNTGEGEVIQASVLPPTEENITLKGKNIQINDTLNRKEVGQLDSLNEKIVSKQEDISATWNTKYYFPMPVKISRVSFKLKWQYQFPASVDLNFTCLDKTQSTISGLQLQRMFPYYENND